MYIVSNSKKEVVGRPQLHLGIAPETRTIVDCRETIQGLDDNNQNLDTIEVIENFVIRENGVSPGKTKYIAEDYAPLQPGQNYILFLIWSPERNAYWINAFNQGKINIDDKDAEEAELAEHDDSLKIMKH